MAIVLLSVLVGFILTSIHAFLARWLGSFLVDDGVARVSGFSFALGVGYSATGNIRISNWEPRVSLLLGVSLGLALIWYLFFKRAKANG